MFHPRTARAHSVSAFLLGLAAAFSGSRAGADAPNAALSGDPAHGKTLPDIDRKDELGEEGRNA